MTGSGADIWGTADGFQYVYRTLTGDGEIVARVVSLTNVHVWSKAGVMLCESLTAGSRHAIMLMSGASGSSFQYRATTGGSSAGDSGTPSTTYPRWIRLVRQGTTIALPSTVFIGLAVTSHLDGTPATALFDNVTLSGP